MNLNTPYYAVIFTSTRTNNEVGYADMAKRMEELAKKQPGYIDFESASGEPNVTISYWETLEDVANWKNNTAHAFAQEKGIKDWYQWYKVRVCKVEREYSFER